MRANLSTRVDTAAFSAEATVVTVLACLVGALLFKRRSQRLRRARRWFYALRGEEQDRAAQAARSSAPAAAGAVYAHSQCECWGRGLTLGAEALAVEWICS